MIAAWGHVATYLRAHPWQRRFLLACVLTSMLLFGWSIHWALAEGGRLPGQGNPALAFINVNDTRGINAWNYGLSIDRGGITAPDKVFWSSFVDFFWGIYRDAMMVAIWFLDWVLSFDWLTLFTTPLLGIGDAMEDVVARFGLVPAFLTCTAFVGVMWILRGKWSTGVYEILFSLVLATLLTGVLAHPVRMVAEPGTGLIYQTRDVGLDFVNAMAKTGKVPDTSSREAMTGRLVDTFIRQPLTIVNFGGPLDGTSCEQAYTDVIKAGPYGIDESTIRDKINDCNPDMGTYAAKPTATMVMAVLVLMPATTLLGLTAALIGGTVILAATSAAYQALKATITTITGLLPGAARGAMFMTIAHTLISIGLIAVTFLFFAIYLQVINSIFGAPGDITQRFFVIDVFMLIALVVFLTQRKRLKSSADRLARLMAARPGGVPTPHRMPDPSLGLMKAATVTQAVHTIASMARRRAPRGGTTPPPSGTGYQDLPSMPTPPAGSMPSAGGAPPAGPAPSGPAPTGPRPNGAPSLPSGPSGTGGRQLPPGGHRAARQLGGVAVSWAAQAAVGYATGGASTVVIGAMRLLPQRPKPALPPGSSDSATPAVKQVHLALPPARRPIAAITAGPVASVDLPADSTPPPAAPKPRPRSQPTPRPARPPRRPDAPQPNPRVARGYQRPPYGGGRRR